MGLGDDGQLLPEFAQLAVELFQLVRTATAGPSLGQSGLGLGGFLIETGTLMRQPVQHLLRIFLGPLTGLGKMLVQRPGQPLEQVQGSRHRGGRSFALLCHGRPTVAVACWGWRWALCRTSITQASSSKRSSSRPPILSRRERMTSSLSTRLVLAP